MDTATFIGTTTLQLLKDGVAVRLHPELYVTDPNDGLDCSGWFNPLDQEIVCATGQSFWLEIYAHEFCHYTQWKDGMMEEEGSEELWDWLTGVDYPYETVEKSVRASQLLEADNERRTVKLIREYDLPIDVQKYCQKSNAYLLFYDVVLRTRRWSKGATPSYTVEEIYGKLPSDRILDDHELKDAPKWFVDALTPRLGDPPKVGWKQKALRLFKSKAAVYDPAC